MKRGERFRARRLAWLGLALPLACGGQWAASDAELAAAEGLVFVPAGESRLPTFSGAFRARAEDALLVDRFEVRRADMEPDLEGERELPATCDWYTAREFAIASGMRLPTASEWMYVAAGRLGHAYPWGQPRRSVANTLELGLGRTIPVGTFESGRGPFGTYDQVGNVWEWVDDYVTGYALGIGAEAGVPEGVHPGLRAAMGGSYRTRLRPLFPAGGGPPVFALAASAKHVADDMGLRRVAGAEGWLRAHLAGLDPRDEGQRERLRALAADWHVNGEAQLVKLLEGLQPEFAGRPGADALATLLEGVRR